MADVFAALGDPTRRQIVDWLAAEGSGTATVFAERLPISRQAVSKHLKELEDAGVVESTRLGRETRFSLVSHSLEDAAGWLESRAKAWDATLDRLTRHIE